MNNTEAQEHTFYRRYGERIIKRIADQKMFYENVAKADGMTRKKAYDHYCDGHGWTGSTTNTKLPVWYQRMHQAVQSHYLRSHFGGKDSTIQSLQHMNELGNALKEIEEENLRRGLPLEPEIEVPWADRQRQNQSHFEPVIISTAIAASAPSPETGSDWQVSQNAPTASLEAAGSSSPDVDIDTATAASVPSPETGSDWQVSQNAPTASLEAAGSSSPDVDIDTATAASVPSPETDPDWQMPQNAPTASPDAAEVDDDMDHPAVEEFMAGCGWGSGGTDLETSAGSGSATGEAPDDAYVRVTDVERPPRYW